LNEIITSEEVIDNLLLSISDESVANQQKQLLTATSDRHVFYLS